MLTNSLIVPSESDDLSIGYVQISFAELVATAIESSDDRIASSYQKFVGILVSPFQSGDLGVASQCVEALEVCCLVWMVLVE